MAPTIVDQSRYASLLDSQWLTPDNDPDFNRLSNASSNLGTPLYYQPLFCFQLKIQPRGRNEIFDDTNNAALEQPITL